MVRFVLIGIILLAVLALLSGYLSGDISDRYENSDVTVEPRENATVVTTSPRSNSNAAIIGFSPDGSVMYYNETYSYYFDVDPVPGTAATVEYIAVELVQENCDFKTRLAGRDGCGRNVVERVNLSTGETERLFDWKSRPKDIGGWHDVDRIDEDRFVVAGSTNDRVFVYNTSTGLIEWQWGAQNAFDTSSGGVFPSDWSHLNDVEHLPDGRVMVSMRNQDQVLFLDPKTGVNESWTLGSDGTHSVLYEQHNPDFIPAERGGPAVLVADSENNRIVEYQRTDDGDWERTWLWQEPRLQWSRDADRLPNGHTLITDSNGNRVLEVDRQGEIVWSLPVDTPYEAERLETGDESAAGQSAASLGGFESRTASVGDKSDNTYQSMLEVVVPFVKAQLPAIVVNGIIFLAPPWFGVIHLMALGVLLGALLLWAILEFKWSAYSLRSPLGRSL